MLTVEDYGKIRIAHRDGMSIRQMARRFGHSRRKIHEVLQESEPHPYTLPQDRPAPRLGPYKAVIEQILVEDEQAPASNGTRRRSSIVGCGMSTATRAAATKSDGTSGSWVGSSKRRLFL